MRPARIVGLSLGNQRGWGWGLADGVLTNWSFADGVLADGILAQFVQRAADEGGPQQRLFPLRPEMHSQ